MSEGTIVRYRPGRDPKPTGKTDWARVRAMSDEEVEANAESDPDNQPLMDDQLAHAFRPGDIRALRETFKLSQAGFAKSVRPEPENPAGLGTGPAGAGPCGPTLPESDCPSP
jgi:hypothetical protein